MAKASIQREFRKQFRLHLKRCKAVEALPLVRMDEGMFLLREVASDPGELEAIAADVVYLVPTRKTLLALIPLDSAEFRSAVQRLRLDAWMIAPRPRRRLQANAVSPAPPYHLTHASMLEGTNLPSRSERDVMKLISKFAPQDRPRSRAFRELSLLVVRSQRCEHRDGADRSDRFTTERDDASESQLRCRVRSGHAR